MAWGVAHIAWNNSGVPQLTLSIDAADPVFNDPSVAVRLLRTYGFQELLGEAAPSE